MGNEEGIWFKRAQDGVGFWPITREGWYSVVAYLFLMGLPPVGLLLYGVKVDGLILFLIFGHVSMMSLCFIGFCFLHSKRIRRNDPPKTP